MLVPGMKLNRLLRDIMPRHAVHPSIMLAVAASIGETVHSIGDGRHMPDCVLAGVTEPENTAESAHMTVVTSSVTASPPLPATARLR